MARIKVGKKIQHKDQHGKMIEFITADIYKLMNTHINVGDEVIIPLNIRKSDVTFWESGGRRPTTVTSIGTVVANAADRLVDAILFSKLDRTPNRKQALMSLHLGYRLYVGKVAIRDNTLAPNIKVIRLVYQGVDGASTDSDHDYIYGRFTADAIMTDYNDIRGCCPAERLITKLFTTDVTKPYYANGWSSSDLSRIRDNEKVISSFSRLAELDIPIVGEMNADKYLDAVENVIGGMCNKNLSVVFQRIDFVNNTMTLAPLSGMELSDIAGTIGRAAAANYYTIPLSEIFNCYNLNVVIGADSPSMLELALKFDTKYAIMTKPQTWCMLRGYRG